MDEGRGGETGTVDVGLVVVGTRVEAGGDRSVFGLECFVGAVGFGAAAVAFAAGAAEALEAGGGPGVTIITSPSRRMDEIFVSVGVEGGNGLGGNPWLTA